MSRGLLVPTKRIERAGAVLRGHEVLLDEALADLYGVSVSVPFRFIPYGQENER